MYKKSYNILKNNMIYVEPLLLWMVVFVATHVFSMHRVQLLFPKVVLWSSVSLLFIACLSGWLYINKYAFLDYNDNDSEDIITEKSLQNLKKFFEGIGIDFFRTLLAFISLLAIYYFILYFTFKSCDNYFGTPEIFKNFVQFFQTETNENIIQQINNMPDIDKIIFSKWILTINFVVSFLNFFAILYLTIMTFERKNFLKSLFLAFKYFILNIFESIGIMIFVFILYILLQILSLFFGSISILFPLFIILISLYLNYYMLIVFCFYNDKIKNKKDFSNFKKDV